MVTCTHLTIETQKIINDKLKNCHHSLFTVITCSISNTYLPVRINQQYVSHTPSLHTAENVLTRGRAALSDQEIPAAGEKGLCLFSAHPEIKGRKVTEKSTGDVNSQEDILKILCHLQLKVLTCRETILPPGLRSGHEAQSDSWTGQQRTQTSLSLMDIKQEEQNSEQ